MLLKLVLFKRASSPKTVLLPVKQPSWQVARACGESAKQASMNGTSSKARRKAECLIEFGAIRVVVFDLNKFMVVVFCSLMVDPATAQV